MQPLAIVPAQPQGQDPAAAAGAAGPSGAQQTAQWILILAAVVLLTWVFMRLSWRRRNRTEDDDPVHQMRETIADRRIEGERAAEVAGIVHELAARLETRAARLEALLDAADAKIEALESHSARLEDRLAAAPIDRRVHGEPRANSSGAAGLEPQPGTGSQPGHGTGADPWAEADHGTAPRHTNGADTASEPPADPLHQEVYELADDGHTPLAIARRLDQQVGTIELILALRR